MLYICNQRTFKTATKKKPSNLPKKIQIWKKSCTDKVLNFIRFDYGSNQLEKRTTATKMYLLE